MKQDGERALRAVAVALLAKGFDEEDAAEIIGAVWSASAEEYGA